MRWWVADLVDAILVHPPTNLNPKRALQSINPLIYPGYGMLYLASFLFKNGYTVKIWNIPQLYLQGESEKEVFKRLLQTESSPTIIGVELNWMYQSRGAIETAKKLKHLYPHVPIIVGGIHASLFAREIAVRYSHCIDAVIRGEAEQPFLECIKRIEAGKPIGNVDSLTLMTKNKLLENPIRVIDNVDEIPPYSLRDFRGDVDSIAPAINVCRGPCPMKCIYCIGPRIPQLFGRKEMVSHSLDWILDQISILIEDGFSQICFLEDMWTIRRKDMRAVAKALVNEGIEEEVRHIDLAAIPGSFNEAVLEDLSRAGVTNIGYGVESGSQRVLDTAKRHVLISQINGSVKASINKGVVPLTYWMVGFPGETKKDVEETAQLLNETVNLGGVPRTVNTLLAVPGTELYENAAEYGVKLRMKNFEDYMVYSDTLANARAWYPRLITHETEHLKVHDILEMASLLRMLIRKKTGIILEKMGKNAKRVVEYHPHLTIDEIMNRFVGVP